MPIDLKELTARAAQTISGRPRPLPEAKPETVLHLPEGPRPRPLAEALAKGMPEPDPALPPREGKGVDPRKTWVSLGPITTEPLAELPDWETAKRQEALRVAVTRAKLGQRLTLAQRRLLANHNLQRAMVRLRKPLGE